MKSRLRIWFLSPAAFVTAILFALPMAIVCAYSLMTRGAYGGVIRPWTIENFARIFDRLYAVILLRSFALAAIATLLCLLLGFPLALYIARSKRRRNLLLNLVMLPFWTSLLIRTYAWMFLLRDTGLVNTLLQSLHIIRQPLPLLFNDGAVILGLVYGYLPFMVLPLYATIEKLDPALLDAAADLGARPWITVMEGHRTFDAQRDGRRHFAGFYSVPGRISDTGSAGRRKNRDGGEPGAKSVHNSAGLAVRISRFAAADRSGSCTYPGRVRANGNRNCFETPSLGLRGRRICVPVFAAASCCPFSASTLPDSPYGKAFPGTGIRGFSK